MEEMSILLAKIDMPPNNKIIESIANFLAVLWVAYALLLMVELAGHLIEKTSDARSHFWRIAFITTFGINALGCHFRFRGWRWIILVPCLLIAIRDYFYIMLSQGMGWGFEQILVATRFSAALGTILLAALWGRLEQRG